MNQEGSVEGRGLLVAINANQNDRSAALPSPEVTMIMWQKCDAEKKPISRRFQTGHFRTNKNRLTVFSQLWQKFDPAHCSGVVEG